MGTLSLDTLDIVNPDLYVERGYPHQEWTLLRREAPVFWYERQSGIPFWAVTKHEDIVTVSRQPELFRSNQILFITAEQPGAPLPDEVILRQLLNMNPPEHGAFRSVVNQRFTPRAIKQLAADIEQITEEVIDALAGREECDDRSVGPRVRPRRNDKGSHRECAARVFSVLHTTRRGSAPASARRPGKRARKRFHQRRPAPAVRAALVLRAADNRGQRNNAQREDRRTLRSHQPS